MVNTNEDVGQFYAAMYWGFVISTSFVGISLVQGYLYFTDDNKDRFSMKALVVSLLVLDPSTSVLMAATIYYYFILNFGVMEVLRTVPITWTIESGITVLVTAIVQIFFASRVYLVNNVVDTLPFGRTAPILVFLFAVIAFVVGTVRTTFIGVWVFPSYARNSFQTFVIIEEASALVSDLLASACLCYMLIPPRLGAMKRSETHKTLFTFMINRAILTSVVQVGMLASYLSARGSLYWMPFHLCKSKLYTNTLLAMLNSRPGGSFQSQTMLQPPQTLPLPTISLTTNDSEGIIESSAFTSEGETEKVAHATKYLGPTPSDPTSPDSPQL